MEETLREQLADLVHEMWSGWMRWVYSKCHGLNEPPWTANIPSIWYIRWQRQMETAYKDLPKRDKDSDRKEADKILRVLEEHWALPRPHIDAMLQRLKAKIITTHDIDIITQAFMAAEYLCEERDGYAAHNAELSREIEQLRKEIDSLKWKQPLF